ncbi:hypothetical protein HZF05_01925 [Sphingomonas sp. CGMCC 1.13654]|uniref:Uncharacterized protein n=1 Tax=Sphingomonas chungangi TaxID=2683589 RepID=A0A838L2G8_9SPHN|nr:hypothetical protein [Sphingomonas chungangi]MBA2932845.1 hypothetical protein [Sphingomonas chungangi]MVW56466.1 hypothetical protein [Sphingomonas chungangi]
MGPEPRLRLLIGAALAAILAVPAGAAQLRTPIAPARSRISEDATIARAATLAQAGDCKAVLGLLDPTVAGNAGAGTPTRFSAQLLRLPCLAAAGRGREVPAVLAELKQVSPTNPVVQGYEVFADVDAGQYAQAADSLGEIADSRSRALALMPGNLWQALAQRLTISGDFARRDRVALSLALADWDPADQPQLSESIASDGVGALLDRKADDDARQLLDRIHRPALLWEMAIEHRYAALWPEIEARLGPSGGIAIDRYARAALDDYAAAPQDPQKQVDAAQAFLALGRFDDVTSIAGSAAIAPRMGEHQIDLVLVDADALAAAGETGKALDRLRPFAHADFKASPSAAGALIPLAEMLDQAGRYDEELAVATAGAAQSDYLSPFGLAWLQRNKVCALSGLGRAAEAKAAGDALKASAKDNRAAAIEGLLCAGRDDEAAAIAIAALATSEGADALADQFQPDGALLPHPASRLRALWARLLARPDVKAAFDRTARILPKTYWPQTTPRPLPAPPSDGTGDGLTTT